MEVVNLKRIFEFDDTKLPDPGPEMSTEEVLGFYSVKYPELTTATVAGPEVKNGEAVYSFNTTVGTKG